MAVAVSARFAVLACVALSFVTTSCRDGATPDGATPTQIAQSPQGTVASSTPSPSEAALCSPLTSVTAGDTRETITSDGLERTYILRVPPAYDGSEPVPLVFNFHGYGSAAAQQHAYSGLPAKADDEGFIVVSPDGTGARQAWSGATTPTGADDVGFVRDVLERLRAQLCIDGNRIFATGISNGAAFSMRLACAMPEIRAVAPVAAMAAPVGCARSFPIVAFHGTDDACVPYDGGPLTCGASRITVPPIEDFLKRWAEHNGCDAAPAHADVTEHVRTIAYSDCADPTSAVLLYRVDGGGHTWPGARDVARLGATTQEISATDVMWEFFASRP